MTFWFVLICFEIFCIFSGDFLGDFIEIANFAPIKI